MARFGESIEDVGEVAVEGIEGPATGRVLVAAFRESRDDADVETPEGVGEVVLGGDGEAVAGGGAALGAVAGRGRVREGAGRWAGLAANKAGQKSGKAQRVEARGPHAPSSSTSRATVPWSSSTWVSRD